MKILAIDDSPTLRKFISKHLSAYSEDYEVITAANGEQGVSAAGEHLPDLILLDFILPDFNGDEVCRRLTDNEKTAGIPVILMSSSAPDVAKTEDQFENIVRSMVKPFSPQLLCAGVSFVLKKQAPANSSPSATKARTDSTPSQLQPHASAPARQPDKKILLCGKSSYFSLYDALTGIELEKATGLLNFKIAEQTHQAYFRDGSPLLVTTRHAETYITGGKLDIPQESTDYVNSTRKKQEETGEPIFLQMVRSGYLPGEQGNAFTVQFGHLLFAKAWTASPCAFEFIETDSFPDSFPDYVPQTPFEDKMINWITLTLRYVNAHSPLVKSIATPEDILSFTSEGFQKIQHLSLTEEEVAFASQLDEGGVTVGKAAQTLNLEWHEVSLILFLFINTRVMTLWPSS